MSDTNISEKISEAITNVIKKTKTFEKTERIGKMMMGVGVICVFNFILSGINYFSFYNLSNQHKQLKYICQNIQHICYNNHTKEEHKKMVQNEVKERKSISVSTSTTDLDTTKDKNIINHEDILYDYCTV